MFLLSCQIFRKPVLYISEYFILYYMFEYARKYLGIISELYWFTWVSYDHFHLLHLPSVMEAFYARRKKTGVNVMSIKNHEIFINVQNLKDSEFDFLMLYFISHAFCIVFLEKHRF